MRFPEPSFTWISYYLHLCSFSTALFYFVQRWYAQHKNMFIMFLSVVQGFFFLPCNFCICLIDEIWEWIWMLLRLLNLSWRRMFPQIVTKNDARRRKHFQCCRLQETKGAFVLWCRNLWINCCELIRSKCSAQHWVLGAALIPRSVLSCCSCTVADLLFSWTDWLCW